VARVSVCVPTFNPGVHLKPALDTVLSQTFTDFELIIVDDCSSEEVETIVFQIDDPRIRFFRNEANLGLVGNWNRCIDLASGEYVSIFHQDDLMDRENIGSKTAILDLYPQVGIVYSNILRIDENSQIIGGHYISQPSQDVVLTGVQLFQMVADTGNPVACPSVMARRECYEKLGRFDDRLPFATDMEMWLRIARVYSVGYLARPLLSHRVHGRQETARFAGSGLDYCDILNALDIAFSNDLPSEYARYRLQAYSTLEGQAWAMANYKLRLGKLKSAWRYGVVAVLARRRSRLSSASCST